MAVQRPPRGDRDRVEQAEAHRARPLGVMPGRPVRAERAARAVEDRVDRRARAAGRVQRGHVGALRHRGVEVDRAAARLGELADVADVVERVDGQQRVALGLRRLAALPSQPVPRGQLALDGDDPLGAFRVRPRIVAQ